jgi:talin
MDPRTLSPPNTDVAIQTASGLQKELVAAGRASKSANQYKKDPAWAQGLISASQTVTFSIRQLVVAAQGASRGVSGFINILFLFCFGLILLSSLSGDNVDEERLQVLASNVNAAAIRLVTSAKVKAVPNSQFSGQLGEVTKAVTAATSQVWPRSVKRLLITINCSFWIRPRSRRHQSLL